MTFETDLKTIIRTIPDYPKPGIMFRDITTLLGDARAFRRAVDELVQPFAGMKIDKVAGIEAAVVRATTNQIRPCQPRHVHHLRCRVGVELHALAPPLD